MKYLFLLLFAMPLFAQVSIDDRSKEFDAIYDEKSKSEILDDAKIASQYWVVWNKKGSIVAIDTTENKTKIVCYPALDCYAFESDKLEDVLTEIKKISLISTDISQIEAIPIIGTTK